MDKLHDYVSMWERSAARMRTPSEGAPRRDLDLNVAVPRMYHYGPPPSGWGAELSGLAAYDPTRAPDGDGFWSVSALWVQQKLRLAGYQIAADGRWGPRSAVALLEFIRDRLRLTVPRFTSDPRSVDAAIGSLPSGYQFDSTSDPQRVALGVMLERFLEPLTSEATPSPPVLDPPPPPPAIEESSSGVGVALPLLFVGAGLAFLFTRR